MIVDQILLGIDVSKKWFDVCVLGDPRRSSRFDNDEKGFGELLEFLGSKPVHVCLEGTGGYERALCLFLSEADVRVSIVNALMVRRALRRKA